MDTIKLSTKQVNWIKREVRKHKLDKSIVVPTELPTEGNWGKSMIIDIDVNKLGVLIPLFKKLRLIVNFAIDHNGMIYINFRYSYTHQGGGSNGNSTSIVIDEKGKSEYTWGYNNVAEFFE